MWTCNLPGMQRMKVTLHAGSLPGRNLRYLKLVSAMRACEVDYVWPYRPSTRALIVHIPLANYSQVRAGFFRFEGSQRCIGDVEECLVAGVQTPQ
jgi:hypothetical protein